jgi:uncharacterized membrane protein
MKQTLCSLVLFSFLFASACAFAPPLKGSRRPVRAASLPPAKLELSSTSTIKTFLAGPEDPQAQFLKQLEKKEEDIVKRLALAKAELSKYETHLASLQTQKASYLASAPDETPAFTETTARSAVKAFCWRLIAGTVTFFTTLRFSGSVTAAVQVVAADFLSKAFTMFAGERLMNKSQAGRKGGADDVGRSIAKALIWRLFAICNTMVLAVFVAKDLSIAGKIASTDAVFKTGLMFFYERVWARIQWGKKYLMEWAI